MHCAWVSYWCWFFLLLLKRHYIWLTATASGWIISLFKLIFIMVSSYRILAILMRDWRFITHCLDFSRNRGNHVWIIPHIKIFWINIGQVDFFLGINKVLIVSVLIVCLNFWKEGYSRPGCYYYSLGRGILGTQDWPIGLLREQNLHTFV
jgi:hypothetical protein